MSDEIHFSPKQREVFRYDNGKEVVSADPLALRLQLRAAAIQRGSTINKLIDAVTALDLKEATDIEVMAGCEATDALVAIVTEAFRLDGADMAHALGLLDAFHQYLEKKNPPAA